MEAPVVTSQDTIEALLKRARWTAAPIRSTFVQQGSRGSRHPGPLAHFVRRHDKRALDLHLLLRATVSAEPWDVRIPAKVWARAMDLDGAESGVAGISRVWGRLEKYDLTARTRKRRQASVVLLCEDGSGDPYTHPATGGNRGAYFQLPHVYWLDDEQWHRHLDLPELAVLIIALSLPGDFTLAREWAPKLFGISADTLEKGLRGLERRGLLTMRKAFKPAPLSPEGYTEERHYSLQPPFTPRQRRRPSKSESAA